MQYYIVILCFLYIEVAYTYYLNLANYFKPLLLIPLLLIPKTSYKSYELRYTIGFTIVSIID